MTQDAYEWTDTLPTIAGSRVVLRSLRDSDVPALFAVFSHPQVMRYWSTPPLAAMEDAVVLLERIHEAFRKRALFQWGIALAGDNRVVGTFTLLNLHRVHRRVEVGYALGREHWGRGIAQDALAAMLSFSFDSLHMHRVEADVDPRNDRSLRLLERNGFRREGCLRERYQVSGEIQDAVMLGLLQPEWHTLREQSHPG